VYPTVFHWFWLGLKDLRDREHDVLFVEEVEIGLGTFRNEMCFILDLRWWKSKGARYQR
jgi:hypothetical protein